MINPRDDEAEDNSEQREPDQAQDVAEDALALDEATNALDSSKPPGGITDDDSTVHDTVDIMNQMLTSGHIDMGAFAGEPLMDDGDGEMPGTPAGPRTKSEDDMMGDAADPMDLIVDSGEDPLAQVVSDEDGYEVGDEDEI